MPIYCNSIAHNAEVFADYKCIVYCHTRKAFVAYWLTTYLPRPVVVFLKQSTGIPFDTNWSSLLSVVIGQNFPQGC